MPTAPPKGFEDINTRNKLASKLRMMVDDYNSSTANRAQSWQLTQQVYDEAKILSSLIFLDELSPYHVALMKTRVDSVASAVVDPITGSNPYVLVDSKSKSLDEVEAIQQTLHYALEQAGFDYKLRNAAFMAAMRSRGPLRLRFETITDELLADSSIVDSMSNPETEVPASDTGQVHKAMSENVRYCGLILDSIPAENMVIYPTYVTQIPEATMVGHWFWQRHSDAVQKQSVGRYFQDIEIPLGQDATSNLPNTIQTPTISDPEDYPVLCYDVCIRLIPEGKKTDQWYRVTFCYNYQLILDMEEYTLPTPWYFAPAFRYEPLTFWPARSIGESLMPLQTIYNDAWTLAIAGAASGSFSSAIVTGYSGDSQNIRLQLGSILTIPQAVGSVTPVQNHFDPETCKMILEGIPEIADSISRISQAANAQDFSPGTTATAVNAVMAGQSAGISEFMQTFGLEIERMADFARFLLAENFDGFKEFHADAIDCTSADQLRGRCTISMNGKDGGSNPQVVMQKIQMLMQNLQQMGVQPVPATKAISIDQLTQMILNTLNFPNDTRKLMVDAPPQPPQAPNAGMPVMPPNGPPPMGPGNQNEQPQIPPELLMAILQALQPSQGGLPGDLPGGTTQGLLSQFGAGGPGIPTNPSLPPPGPNPGVPISPLA